MAGGASATRVLRMKKTLLSLPVIAMIGTLAGFGSPAVADPGRPLPVVALGDSISTANACDGCTAFPELYGGLLADQLGREVQVDNRSIPGAVTQWLMGQLKNDDESRAAVAAADVVVVTIGFNETPWGRID